MNAYLDNLVDHVIRSFDEEGNSSTDYQIVNIEEEPGFHYESIPLEERDPSLNIPERRSRRRRMYYLDDLGSLDRASSGSLTYYEHNGRAQYVVELNNEDSGAISESESINSDGHSSLNSTDLSFDEDSDESDLSEDEGENLIENSKTSCFVSGTAKLRGN